MSPIVNTSHGRLEGIEEDGVLAFKGIPFAAPPVGDLRWVAPQPVAPWSGVRDAGAFGPASPQPERPPGVLGGGGSYASKSEDCLYLNVWTPATDNNRRPVLFWIHGGGFTIGYGGDPRYQGSYMAAVGDVVVVTVNYRLGALGFLHLEPEDGAPAPDANCGILDLVQALEWVRDEISAFGGDPGNVTIFGESAGSMCVSTLLGTPSAKGLFHKAIAQSGGTNATISAERAAATGVNVLAALNLGPSELNAARKIPAEAILAAQQKAQAQSREPMSFGPVVDGAVLPVHPAEAIRDGMSRDIPLISGSNQHEYKLLLGIAGRDITEEALQKLAASRLGANAGRMVEGYREALQSRGEDASAPEVWSAIATDEMFGVPNVRLAEAQAKHGAPAFVYLFTWRSPALDGWLGSCHAIDVPFVFGSLHHPILSPFTGSGPEADALSQQVMGAWLAFARTGDPSSAGVGAWPRYEPTDRSTMLFGRTVKVEKAPRQDQLALWDGLL